MFYLVIETTLEPPDTSCALKSVFCATLTHIRFGLNKLIYSVVIIVVIFCQTLQAFKNFVHPGGLSFKFLAPSLRAPGALALSSNYICLCLMLQVWVSQNAREQMPVSTST